MRATVYQFPCYRQLVVRFCCLRHVDAFDLPPLVLLNKCNKSNSTRKNSLVKRQNILFYLKQQHDNQMALREQERMKAEMEEHRRFLSEQYGLLRAADAAMAQQRQGIDTPGADGPCSWSLGFLLGLVCPTRRRRHGKYYKIDHPETPVVRLRGSTCQRPPADAVRKCFKRGDPTHGVFQCLYATEKEAKGLYKSYVGGMMVRPANEGAIAGNENSSSDSVPGTHTLVCQVNGLVDALIIPGSGVDVFVVTPRLTTRLEGDQGVWL